MAEASAQSGDVSISADFAAQSLAAIHGEPQLAYHGKSQIWEDEPLYERFFALATAPHIVYSTSLVRTIHEYKRQLREKNSRPNIEDKILEFLSQRGAPYLFAAAIGQCQDVILDLNVPNKFDLSFGELVSPTVAQEYWMPLIASLAAYSSTLNDAATGGRIRSTEVRSAALNSFSQLVFSAKSALEDAVFVPFRAVVMQQNSSPLN